MRKKADIVLRNGRPASVILAIGDYEDLLERAEDLDDLRRLRRTRRTGLRFRSVDAYMNERRRRA